MMSTKHRALRQPLEKCISDYNSQDDNADPEVGASTLGIPWLMKVVVVGRLTSLCSPIPTAKISARTIQCKWQSTRPRT